MKFSPFQPQTMRFRLTMILTAVGLLAFWPYFARAEVVHREISPLQVNAEAKTFRGAHQVFWDSEVSANGMLFVSLGGTKSLPSDFRALDILAAQKGFQVLGIDYDNHVISTSCENSSDDFCFDKFRQEVVLGQAGSPLLQVSKADAIVTRITDLLMALVSEDPERWGTFISEGQVQWQKVVIVGHSQGSGHAAYISKLYGLRGVLLFAGPQDRFKDASRPVSWLQRPGKTLGTSYYSFLHHRDFFGVQGQVRVAEILQAVAPGQGMNIFITDESVGDPHMSVLSDYFVGIWSQILDRQLSSHNP